jgi:uncharacterized protein (DUF697 family)
MAQETTGSGATQRGDAAEVAASPATTEMSDVERDELASRLVDRLSLWSGAAGLIPLPLVDTVTVGGIQLHMLRKLSEIYGVPFSENRGKSILGSIAGAMIPSTTATAASSLVKFVPVIGTAIGQLTMAAVSAPTTWVLGKVFIQHFASGGTLLDFNPPDYREFIKTQRERWALRPGAVPPPAQPTAPAARSPSSKSPATTGA